MIACTQPPEIAAVVESQPADFDMKEDLSEKLESILESAVQEEISQPVPSPEPAEEQEEEKEVEEPKQETEEDQDGKEPEKETGQEAEDGQEETTPEDPGQKAEENEEVKEPEEPEHKAEENDENEEIKQPEQETQDNQEEEPDQPDPDNGEKDVNEEEENQNASQTGSDEPEPEESPDSDNDPEEAETQEEEPETDPEEAEPEAPAEDTQAESEASPALEVSQNNMYVSLAFRGDVDLRLSALYLDGLPLEESSFVLEEERSYLLGYELKDASGKILESSEISLTGFQEPLSAVLEEEFDEEAILDLTQDIETETPSQNASTIAKAVTEPKSRTTSDIKQASEALNICDRSNTASKIRDVMIPAVSSVFESCPVVYAVDAPVIAMYADTTSTLQSAVMEKEASGLGESILSLLKPVTSRISLNHSSRSVTYSLDSDGNVNASLSDVSAPQPAASLLQTSFQEGDEVRLYLNVPEEQAIICINDVKITPQFYTDELGMRYAALPAVDSAVITVEQPQTSQKWQYQIQTQKVSPNTQSSGSKLSVVAGTYLFSGLIASLWLFVRHVKRRLFRC